MEKVAIRVNGDRSFFADVAAEAARIDRSPSWLLSRCLGAALPKLSASMAVAAPPVAADAPRAAGRSTFTFFVPRELAEHCARLAVRLRISSDDVVAWAWTASRDLAHAMPSS